MRRNRRLKGQSSKRLRPLSKARATYERLESRLPLAAIVSLDSASGTLSIELPENGDSVAINLDGGLVTLNGSTDLDGGQTLNAADLRNVDISGDLTKADQVVTLAGDYTNANGAALQQLDITDVGNVLITGLYDFSGDVSVTLSNSDGAIDDSNAGQLTVAGDTVINAGDNVIRLDNSDNDFNTLSISTGGMVRNANIADANELVLICSLHNNIPLLIHVLVECLTKKYPALCDVEVCGVG